MINTGTTIVTFLMVFLIQNTQNRDSHAIHLKLDELILAHKHARNQMMALEELSEQELTVLHKRYEHLAAVARERAEREITSGTPNLDEVAEDIEEANAAEAEAETAEAVAHVSGGRS